MALSGDDLTLIKRALTMANAAAREVGKVRKPIPHPDD